MSIQYHFNNNEKRHRIIALEDAFHGDTFGAMSASGLSVYNGAFEDFFLEVDRIPVPTKENFEQVKKVFTKLVNTKEVSCFIYEPIVQGANCMKMYEGELLNELLKIAQEKRVLCIADEVMTGFGKTGKAFASQYMENQPDIMCLSKALTGGLVPLALTTTTQSVYEAFLSSNISAGFFHGHTYSANPTACTAASVCIDIYKSIQIQDSIIRIRNQHEQFNEKIKNHPKVKNTRQIGIIYAIDLNVTTERYSDLRNKLFHFYMKKGVFLRPLGNTVYILPPYIITNIELNKIYEAIEESFKIF